MLLLRLYWRSGHHVTSPTGSYEDQCIWVKQWDVLGDEAGSVKANLMDGRGEPRPPFQFKSHVSCLFI